MMACSASAQVVVFGRFNRTMGIGKIYIREVKWKICLNQYLTQQRRLKL